jgi:hypothetical protein
MLNYSEFNMSSVERYEFNGKIYTRYPDNKSGRKNYFYTDNGKKSLHRAIWSFHNGLIPKGHHIHHKDGNHLNNKIENLECLTPKEHFQAHSRLAKEDPTKDIFITRRKWQKSKDGLDHHSKLAKSTWENHSPIEINCEKCDIKIIKRHLGQIKNKLCRRCQRLIRNPLHPRLKKEQVVKIIYPITVQCKVCGSDCLQKSKRVKEYCSFNCKAQGRRLQGSDNVERKCLICDDSFIINKYAPTQTCSDLCRSECIRRAMRRE